MCGASSSPSEWIPEHHKNQGPKASAEYLRKEKKRGVAE